MSDQPTEVIPQSWTSSIVPGMAPAPAASVLDQSEPDSGRVTFDVVLRGYERHQVDRHLADLAERNERLHADLELAHSRELAALQDASRARAELGWQPQFAQIETILGHAWQWHRKLHGITTPPVATEPDGVPPGSAGYASCLAQAKGVAP